MDAIDQKIIKELETLPVAVKHKVLAFIKGLKATKAPNHAPTEDIDETSVSENPEEYFTISEFISSVQGLPAELQSELLKYLETLKAKARKITGETDHKPQNTKKKPFKFKPGFGGAKGFFILKEGWDEPLDELFKDYM